MGVMRGRIMAQPETITRTEKEHMMFCMAVSLETIQESKCRCEAINKKMRKAAIEGIAQIKEISFYKAKKIYSDQIFEEFHACCIICCDCHFDKFRDEQGVY